MASQQRQRNITFREKEIQFLLSRAWNGDSCSVVGVGSVGKSNLLQHMMEPSVQHHHLGKEPAQSLTLVVIDPNNMLGPLPSPLGNGVPSAWPGYEIMMHRLYKAFYPLPDQTDEERQTFFNAYHWLQNESPILALRYLELGLEQLLRSDSTVRRQHKILFIFDEFEAMLRQLPPKFFQTLRGLRDVYKYRMMFLTFTRSPITQIIEEDDYSTEDQEALEPFVELFTDNLLFLGPYSEEDAIAMMDRLAERQGVNCSPIVRRFLLHVTNGHAGLLRASFRLTAEQLPMGTPEDKVLQFLTQNTAVRTECETIWTSLSKVEWAVLKQIANGRLNVDEATIRLLSAKQLLRVHGQIEIIPPLFREFVRQRAREEP